MTSGECYLCTHVPMDHRIHGLDEIELCYECQQKFIYLRYLADPTSGSVLGFECKYCGFTCDVAGIVEQKMVDGEMTHTVKVDNQHKFCQSCGESSRVEQNDKT